jgi:hypothetical protein
MAPGMASGRDLTAAAPFVEDAASPGLRGAASAPVLTGMPGPGRVFRALVHAPHYQ